MTEQELAKFLEVMDGIKNDAGVKSIYDDTINFYYPNLNKLSVDCKQVWDISLYLRLKAAQTTVDTKYERAMAYLPKTGVEIPKIYFGQMRIGPDFQGSQSDIQTKIVGLPDVIGRPLDVISGRIRDNEIDNASIPVQIFYSDQKWIAANNRGYATHCMAGKRPLRVWPRTADQAELNRLKEVEGKGDIPTLTYLANVERLTAKPPRTLPSEEIPITSGPNTWQVARIVKVP
jgi:hypothetical protein